jgi:hypothetical protein
LLHSNNYPFNGNINWGNTGRTFATSFAAGNIAKGAYKAGDILIRMPNTIGSDIGTKTVQSMSYGAVSGITANIACTLFLK